MIIRAVWAWLGLAVAVMGGAYVVAGQVDLPTILRALLFTSPATVLVARGHLGKVSLSYPTTRLTVFVLWQLTGLSMAASLRSSPPYVYSEEAVLYGDIVYFAWGWLYAIASGRASTDTPAIWAVSPRAQSVIPYATVGLLWIATALVMIVSGHLSTYYNPQASDMEVGGPLLGIYMIYAALAPNMPAIALLMWNRCESNLRIPLAIGIMVATATLLFLAGGRTSIFFAAALVATTFRYFGARMRPATVGAAAVGLLVISIAIVSYRNALIRGADPQGAGLSQLDAATTALKGSVDPKSSEATMQEARTNITARLAYAPVYFVTVDHVLRHGPTLTPHFLQGPLLIIPTIFLPEKIAWARSYDLRADMYRTGRLPAVDLDLSPILEWVFDLGVLLAPLGGILYGLLARFVDRSIERAPYMSLARWILLGSFARLLMTFESSGDSLFVNMREPIAVAAIAVMVTGVVAAWRGSWRGQVQTSAS